MDGWLCRGDHRDEACDAPSRPHFCSLGWLSLFPHPMVPGGSWWRPSPVSSREGLFGPMVPRHEMGLVFGPICLSLLPPCGQRRTLTD